MTNKEAIGIIGGMVFASYDGTREQDEAVSMSLGLMRRMAMYEWMWSLDDDQLEDYGLAGMLADCPILPLSGDELGLVKTAWEAHA